MNFTIETLSASLSNYLSPYFPGVNFYKDPNQQKTKPPCAFLQARYSSLELETAGYWIRTIGIDLTYLLDYNLPNMQTLYENAAEKLDILMETFPYTDGENTSLMRCYEREWKIDLDALHYNFEIRARVSLPDNTPKVESIDSMNTEVAQ